MKKNINNAIFNAFIFQIIRSFAGTVLFFLSIVIYSGLGVYGSGAFPNIFDYLLLIVMLIITFGYFIGSFFIGRLLLKKTDKIWLNLLSVYILPILEFITIILFRKEAKVAETFIIFTLSGLSELIEKGWPSFIDQNVVYYLFILTCIIAFWGLQSKGNKKTKNPKNKVNSANTENDLLS